MDFSKVSAKLESLAQKSQQFENKSKEYIWKITPGSHTLRVLPYIHNREFPFLELYFHYELTGYTLLSPISNNNPDPVAEFAEKLKKMGGDLNYELGKKLAPKARVFAPILVRGKENEGIKFWGFSNTVYQTILSYIADPDYGDITDLQNGRDIVVDYTPVPGSFARTTVRVKPNVSPATTDASVVESIKKMPKIFEIYPEPSYEEMEGYLKAYMKSADDTEDEPKQANEVSASPAVTASPNIDLVVNNVSPQDKSKEDAFKMFQDLMGK